MYTGVHPFLRRLHIWIGLLLFVPLLLVGITAIMLAHDQSLGLKDIRIQSSWLPQSWIDAEHKRPEIKAWLPGEAGSAIVGTKSGAYLWDGQRLNPIKVLDGLDIRSLEHWHGAILAASKQGAYLGVHGSWKQVWRGDAHDFNADEEGNLYIVGHHDSVLISRDGGESWQKLDGIAAKLEAQASPRSGTDLKHLIKGLHTGRMLVGKQDEWLWIDVISGLLVATALIGVFRWYRKRKVF